MYKFISKKVGITWDSLEMQENDTTIIFDIVTVTLKKILIFYKYEKYSVNQINEIFPKVNSNTGIQPLRSNLLPVLVHVYTN